MHTTMPTCRTGLRSLFVWLPDWWVARSAQAWRSAATDHPLACWRTPFGM